MSDVKHAWGGFNYLRNDLLEAVCSCGWHSMAKHVGYPEHANDAWRIHALAAERDTAIKERDEARALVWPIAELECWCPLDGDPDPECVPHKAAAAVEKWGESE